MFKTLVTFLLDRTGSMGSIKDQTIESFNAYIEELKKDDNDTTGFTFIQFDNFETRTICCKEYLELVPTLTHENFQPRGLTNLIDAACEAIHTTEKYAERYPDAKVIVCIQTDGHENASVEYTWEQLNDLVKEKYEKGWQFNFMGAGIDAYKQAHKMGISGSATVSYVGDDYKKSKVAFQSAASNTRAFASGKTMSVDYSDAQKDAAGDQYRDKN